MAKKVTNKMYTDFKKFKSAWEKDADSPYNTIMYYLIAALNIEKDPDLANAMMTVVVSKNDSVEDSKSPSGRKLRRTGAAYYIGQFQRNTDIAKSFVGGTQENDYQIDEDKLVMTVVKEQDKRNKEKKIFIQSGGKDNPTPVTLARNKSGQWKLIEYSSICTGVKPRLDTVGDF
ncbi:MAG: hypothetical protein GF411_06170 [Candidatus Lokiarchaeota archaeon]|nr:hypothetical protein [Candidatus Lokiarchaeota archaeon]